MSEQPVDAPPAAETAPVETPEVAVEAPIPPKAQEALSMLLEREASLQAQRTEMKADQEKLARWGELEKLSPVEAARAMGLDLQEYQKAELDAYDPNAAMTKKLSQLQERMEARDAKDMERAREAAIREVQNDVNTYVEGSDLPLTKALGMESLVYETILASKQNGKQISKAEAASQVEASLSKLVEKAQALERATPPAPEPETIKQPRVSLSNSASSDQASLRKEPELSSSRSQEALESFASILRFNKK